MHGTPLLYLYMGVESWTLTKGDEQAEDLKEESTEENLWVN
jgi:hypothetical protein